MKLPFDMILRTVQALCDKYVIEDDEKIYQLYLSYLSKSGWSEKEFEDALLKYIDNGWTPLEN